MLANTRDAHEVERKRRIAWEHGIETRYTQQHADMERTMLDMRHELASLRAFVATNLSQGFTRALPFDSYSLALEQQQRHNPIALPISPVSQPSSFHHSALADADPTSHADDSQIFSNDAANDDGLGVQQDAAVVEPPSPAPSPAPQPESSLHAASSTLRRSSRRKRTPESIHSDEGSSQEEGYRSDSERPRKRINHHDKRCLTIHVRFATPNVLACTHSSLASDAFAHSAYDAIRVR